MEPACSLGFGSQWSLLLSLRNNFIGSFSAGLKFLAHHFTDSALQIGSGYVQPSFQASSLARVIEVNLVSNGLRLRGVTHLRRLP
jgi:hypothetical protein